MRIGTPPVLALAALDVALDAWEGVEMADVRARSIELSERLIAGVEASCPTLDLASPRNPDNRGSQVAFRHPSGPRRSPWGSERVSSSTCWIR